MASKLKALIVDDSKLIRQLEVSALKGMEIDQIEMAVDGEEAMVKLSAEAMRAFLKRWSVKWLKPIMLNVSLVASLEVPDAKPVLPASCLRHASHQSDRLQK